ncbi:hypothetical protein AVEN_168773-1 [Araneus ventricosus]|uniref:Uncharacterized protein n=1 Tax=Araneus ventricosus TaxID=182803 RepID=A0A4Y2GFR9_ARAVE|nr:hypothetical protein AVEN_168773-1 [Araneus ventricosus]
MRIAKSVYCWEQMLRECYLWKESVKLDSGLFLLKTRLGFVLTGKQEVSGKCNERCDTVLNVSLFVKDSSINELYSLESTGIVDPIQRLNENNEHLKVIDEFKNSMKILPDGRYELCLPFKSVVIELPSNQELTWKRHKKNVRMRTTEWASR